MKRYLILFVMLNASFVNAQALQNIIFKAGAGLAYQSKSPELMNDNNDMQLCYAFGLEPEIYRFGAQKNMALSLDMLYLRKGGTNTSYIRVYDQNNQLTSEGSVSVPIRINYLSFAPNFKYEFAKLFFVKAGPRIDIYTSHAFDQLPPNIPAPESSYSFDNTCYGINYAIGTVLGQAKFRCLIELLGQNDFTTSSANSSTGQSFKNNSYCINFGLVYLLK